MVHNPYHVKATQIAHSLDKVGCVTTITSDGGADGRWALEAMKYGVHNTIEMQETSVRWPVILSGVLVQYHSLGEVNKFSIAYSCFLILLIYLTLTFALAFSYIGGNWRYHKYLALVSFALGAPFIAVKAYHSLHRLKCDTNVLV